MTGLDRTLADIEQTFAERAERIARDYYEEGSQGPGVVPDDIRALLDRLEASARHEARGEAMPRLDARGADGPVPASVPTRLDDLGPLPGSIAAVEEKLRELREAYRMAGDDAQRSLISAQIDGLEQVRDGLDGVKGGVLEWRDALDYVVEGMNLVAQASQALSEHRLSVIARERDDALGAIDREIEAVGTRKRVLTQEEAERERLLARRSQLEAEYADRERAEKRRAAKIDKALAVFRIAIDTALAVMAQARTGNLWGAIAAGVLGAVQGGIVAATPIPQFAGGVTGFTGGLAVVGERGPELVSLPGGSNVVTNENLNFVRSLLAVGGGSGLGAAPAAGGVSGSATRELARGLVEGLESVEWRIDGATMKGAITNMEHLRRAAGLE